MIDKLVRGLMFPGIQTKLFIDLENIYYIPIPEMNCVAPLFCSSYSSGSPYVILYCHTNGTDLNKIYKSLKLISRGTRCHVVAPEYPGYGIFAGTPSPELINLVCINAIKFLNKVLGWPLSNILLWGCSIGSGIVLKLINYLVDLDFTEPQTDSEETKIWNNSSYSFNENVNCGNSNHIGCIILQASFVSISHVAKSLFGWPVSHVISNTYFDNENIIKEKLNKLNSEYMNVKLENDSKKTYYKVNKRPIPILWLHGAKDKLFNFKNICKLYNSYNGPKRMHVYKNSDHNTFSFNEVISDVKKFISDFVHHHPVSLSFSDVSHIWMYENYSLSPLPLKCVFRFKLTTRKYIDYYLHSLMNSSTIKESIKEISGNSIQKKKKQNKVNQNTTKISWDTLHRFYNLKEPIILDSKLKNDVLDILELDSDLHLDHTVSSEILLFQVPACARIISNNKIENFLSYLDEVIKKVTTNYINEKNVRSTREHSNNISINKVTTNVNSENSSIIVDFFDSEEVETYCNVNNIFLPIPTNFCLSDSCEESAEYYSIKKLLYYSNYVDIEPEWLFKKRNTKLYAYIERFFVANSEIYSVYKEIIKDDLLNDTVPTSMKSDMPVRNQILRLMETKKNSLLYLLYHSNTLYCIHAKQNLINKLTLFTRKSYNQLLKGLPFTDFLTSISRFSIINLSLPHIYLIKYKQNDGFHGIVIDALFLKFTNGLPEVKVIENVCYEFDGSIYEIYTLHVTVLSQKQKYKLIQLILFSCATKLVQHQPNASSTVKNFFKKNLKENTKESTEWLYQSVKFNNVINDIVHLYKKPLNSYHYPLNGHFMFDVPEFLARFLPFNTWALYLLPTRLEFLNSYLYFHYAYNHKSQYTVYYKFLRDLIYTNPSIQPILKSKMMEFFSDMIKKFDLEVNEINELIADQLVTYEDTISNDSHVLWQLYFHMLVFYPDPECLPVIIKKNHYYKIVKTMMPQMGDNPTVLHKPSDYCGSKQIYNFFDEDMLSYRNPLKLVDKLIKALEKPDLYNKLNSIKDFYAPHNLEGSYKYETDFLETPQPIRLINQVKNDLDSIDNSNESISCKNYEKYKKHNSKVYVPIQTDYFDQSSNALNTAYEKTEFENDPKITISTYDNKSTDNDGPSFLKLQFSNEFEDQSDLVSLELLNGYCEIIDYIKESDSVYDSRVLKRLAMAILGAVRHIDYLRDTMERYIAEAKINDPTINRLNQIFNNKVCIRKYIYSFAISISHKWLSDVVNITEKSYINENNYMNSKDPFKRQMEDVITILHFALAKC